VIEIERAPPPWELALAASGDTFIALPDQQFGLLYCGFAT